MKRDTKLYVKDILDAILAIERFVEGMNFEQFKEDDKTSSAVIRKFEIIGEATGNVRFRDRNTIKMELPELKTKIKKVLTGLREK